MPTDNTNIMPAYEAAKGRYNILPYSSCGQSGLKLPPLSLGLWQNFGQDTDTGAVREICRTALDNGITHFGLANNYGPPDGSAEEQLAKILAQDFKPYRDEPIISTKEGYEMSPDHTGTGETENSCCPVWIRAFPG